MRAAFSDRLVRGKDGRSGSKRGFKMCLTKKMPPHIMGIKVQAVMNG